MPISRFIASIAAMFRPPFKGLGAVMWLYFAWCFIVHPHSPIMRGELVDTDDSMHLAQVLGWLQGQSWFDTAQHRLNPPDGTPIHFSRIAELPLAAMILPLRSVGLSWIASATLAAAVWPLVLLALMLTALRWLAKSFMPADWAGVTAYIAIFAATLSFQFTPGHVQHHGLSVLLIAVAFGCVVRMMAEPENIKWGAAAGFFLALAMAIALESLPWLLVLSIWVGLWMMASGRKAALSGVAFGQALYFSSGAFLAITLPHEAWFKANILAYSIVYVMIAGGIAVCFAAIALSAMTRFAALRYVTGISLGLASAALFLTRFPELLSGPYGAMDKSLAAIILNNIVEAKPLVRLASSWADVGLRLMLPLMAFCSALFFMWRARKPDEVFSWLLTSVLILVAIFLTTFYQSRFDYYAVMFAVVPVAAMLRHSLAWAGNRWHGRKMAAAELGLILLAGPLPGVILPAVVDGRPFNTGVLLFPVEQPATLCESSALWDALNDGSGYGDRQRVIINSMNEGAELLFRTKHMALSAPYHTDVGGNVDATRFFSTTDPLEARKIATDRHADLVLLCDQLPGLYRGDKRDKLIVGADGKIPDSPAQSFAEQLKNGKIPDWLKPVQNPFFKDYLLFEVR